MAYYPPSYTNNIHHLSCPSYLHSGISQSYFHSSPSTTHIYRPEPPPHTHLLPCPPPKPPDPPPFLSTKQIHSQQLSHPHSPWQELPFADGRTVYFNRITKEYTCISPPANEPLQHRDELFRTPSRASSPPLAPPRAPSWKALLSPSQALPSPLISAAADRPWRAPSTTESPQSPPLQPLHVASDETKENETESSLAPREPQRTPPPPPQAPPWRSPSPPLSPSSSAISLFPANPPPLSPLGTPPWKPPCPPLAIAFSESIKKEKEQLDVLTILSINAQDFFKGSHGIKDVLRRGSNFQCASMESKGDGFSILAVGSQRDLLEWWTANISLAEKLQEPLDLFEGDSLLSFTCEWDPHETKLINFLFYVAAPLSHYALSLWPYGFGKANMHSSSQIKHSLLFEITNYFNLEDKVDFEGVGNDRGLSQRKIKRIIRLMWRVGIG